MFENLQKIGGAFQIIGLATLTTLKYFGNLVRVGGIVVLRDNPKLTDMRPLQTTCLVKLESSEFQRVGEEERTSWCVP